MTEQAAIDLRRAADNDRKALWLWRQDSIHLKFYRGEPVSQESHRAWFQGLLQDQRRMLLIGWRDSLRVGALMLEQTDRGDWQSNVLVKPVLVGQGVGRGMLQALPLFLAGDEDAPSVRRIRHALGTDVEPQGSAA